MSVHQSNSFRETQERKEKLFKAVELQQEFKKSWNSYRENPSNAQKVIDLGEELMSVQKSMGGKALGALGPNQVLLRVEVAKDAIRKGLAKSATKKSDGSTWEHYYDENGHKVTKIG